MNFHEHVRNSSAIAGSIAGREFVPAQGVPHMANRIAPSIFASTLFIAAASALLAQDASQANPYQGVSHPPADDQITTSVPADKPPAGTPMNAAPAPPVAPETYVPPAAPPPGSQDPAQYQAQAPSQSQDQSEPSSIDPAVSFPS